MSAIYKTLSYLARTPPYALEKPKVLQFPVIDICNSQCQMCKIWENKKSDDILPDALRAGLRNPLYSDVTGVGLNGGEPTLRKDLGALAAVLCEELPKLKNISLITNAYKYREVIVRIADVGKVARQHGVNLDVMVSLDGYGEVHDRVRGKPGNFQRAQHVIDFITASSLVKSVRIGCTIIRENVYGLHDLFEYAQSRGLYIKYRLGVPHQRLYTADLVEPYALNPEEKYHVSEFLEGLIKYYERNAQQAFFYRSLVGQILHGAPRTAGCDWQHRGATITSKGELLFCAVQSKRLGFIQEGDSEAAYFGNAKHMEQITGTKCASCNHDYMGVLPRGVQLKRIAHKAIEKSGTRRLVDQLRGDSKVGRLRSSRRFASRVSQMTALAATAAAPELIPARGLGPKVLICGWYGTETLGDKAILGGVIHALTATLGSIELTVASLFPYVTRITQRQMPELRHAEIVGVEDAIRLVKEMELVVFGGGPLMGIGVLAEMESIIVAARERGIPTLLAGCGVGPLGEKWHNDSLKRILANADLRIYRDDKSRIAAASLGADTSNDIVAEDPAFTWLNEMRGSLSMERTVGRKILLLGLRDFPYEQYARHLTVQDSIAAKSRYEHEVILALEQIVERSPGLQIRPLPMCTNHLGDDDRWFYRRIFRGNEKLAPRLDLSLLGGEMPPADYCSAFAAADVVIAMRFHSLVFALGLGVPTVAIDYTLGKGKVQALAERFGVAYQSLAEMDARFLVASVEKLLANPAAPKEVPEPTFTTIIQARLPGLMRTTGKEIRRAHGMADRAASWS
jgi:polysaccharide pyruvyl transferase WcaK-like protein/sulfatase maturation enzyme AslB (radical SAM superfamily)